MIFQLELFKENNNNRKKKKHVVRSPSCYYCCCCQQLCGLFVYRVMQVFDCRPLYQSLARCYFSSFPSGPRVVTMCNREQSTLKGILKFQPLYLLHLTIERYSLGYSRQTGSNCFDSLYLLTINNFQNPILHMLVSCYVDNKLVLYEVI